MNDYFFKILFVLSPLIIHITYLIGRCLFIKMMKQYYKHKTVCLLKEHRKYVVLLNNQQKFMFRLYKTFGTDGNQYWLFLNRDFLTKYLRTSVINLANNEINFNAPYILQERWDNVLDKANFPRLLIRGQVYFMDEIVENICTVFSRVNDNLLSVYKKYRFYQNMSQSKHMFQFSEDWLLSHLGLMCFMCVFAWS